MTGVSMWAILHWRDICVWEGSANVNPSAFFVHRISSWKTEGPLEEVSVPLRAHWTWTSSSSFSPQGLLPSVLWLLPEGFTWARNNRCLSRGLPTCWGSWLTGALWVVVWKDRGLTERKQLSGQAKRSEMRVAGRWQTRRMGLVVRRNGLTKTQMCELFWRQEADRSICIEAEQEFRVRLCCGVHQAFQSQA